MPHTNDGFAVDSYLPLCEWTFVMKIVIPNVELFSPRNPYTEIIFVSRTSKF